MWVVALSLGTPNPGVWGTGRKVLLLSTAILFVLCAMSASAATYYVDATGGNDSKDGLSNATPWKTIAKVNAASFNPGDTILFKRGETWRDANLGVIWSGSSGSPITFGAYGSGAKPIFNGADLKTSWVSEGLTANANLESNPEAFNNWSHDAMTVNANSPWIYSPKNTLTVDTLKPTATEGYSQIYDFPSLNASTQYTFSVYAAALFPLLHRWIMLEFIYFDSDWNQTLGSASCYFDIGKGTAAIGTCNGTDASSLTMAGDASNGSIHWYRASITDTTPPGTVNSLVFIHAADADGDQFVTEESREEYAVWYGVWGAKVEQSSSPSPYESGTVYYANSTVDSLVAFEDGARMNRHTAKDLFVNSYYYDAGNSRVYVRTSGDNSPSGYTIETGSRDYCVTIGENESYITFDGIHFKNANADNVLSEGTHITIQDCESSWSQGNGIVYGDYASDNVLSGCSIHDNGYAGVIAWKNAASPGHENIISQNEINDNLVWGVYLVANYYIVEKNLIRDNGNLGEMCNGIELFDGDNDGYGQHNTIRYNRVYGQLSSYTDGTGICADDYTKYTAIYGNIVYGCDGAGIGAWRAQNVNISGNVVYGNNRNSGGTRTTTGEMGVGSFNPGEVSNIIIKNNIAQATGANTSAIWLDANTYNSSGLDITNNTWYSAATNWYIWNTSGGNNLSTWNSYTGVGTDLNANPLFTNASAANFTLQAGSPAIDAGADLGSAYQLALDPASSWPSGVLTLNQGSYGSGWEIGAYVFQSSGPATFYVDASNGNDSNNGLSNATPWKTLAKVNGASFNPGEMVLFKRGETWREQLTVPSSGNTTHPITFGAYGTGERPIISGADLITMWGLNSTNVWSASVTTQPKQVFFNGIRGTRTNYSDLNAQSEWNWSNNVLYVYSTSDPDTAYTSPGVEAGQRDSSILIANKGYVKIDGIDGRYTNSNIFIIGGVGNHTTIQNSIASWGAGNGIGIYDNYGGSNLFDSNTIHDVEADGISAEPHKGSGLGTETIIRNNTIYNAYKFGIWLHANYYIVENNIVYDSGHNDKPGEEFVGIIIYSSSAGDNAGHNNIVKYNLVHGIRSGGNEGTGIETDRWTAGNVIYYNLAYNNDASGFTIYGAPNNTFYNNVAFDNNKNSSGELVTKGEFRIGGTPTEKSSNVNVKNNIGYATQPNTYAIHVDQYSYNQSLNITNNDWFAVAANWYYLNTTAGNNLSMWNEYSDVGTDIFSDPLFVNATAHNFSLQASSPCIDTGTNVNLTRDFAGNPVPSGSAPDIGAFEYQSNGTSPPVISSVQNTSITNQSVTISWSTNIAANETLRYGTTTALLNSSSNASFGTSHSRTLSGLTNNTRYYYNITACNSGGNCSTNGTYNFTTLQNSNPAPVISSVQNGSVTNVSAVLTWLTDIAANSSVRYGTTLALLNSTVNASFGTNHSVLLTGLVNNTRYYYNITACNSYGNCSTNGTYNFTTLQTTPATTYYVDATSGNDSNSGTSNATAWQTIAKVNAASFNPRDTILFKRGEVWREMLTLPSSGNATNPIVLGAYGNGSRPRITGADVLSTSGWGLYPNSSYTYQKTLTTDPGQYILEDGAPLFKTSNISAVEATPSFYWASNTLYLHASGGSNPGSNGKTYEAPTRFYTMSLNSKGYITIENMTMEMGRGDACINGNAANYSVLKNSDVRYCNGYGLWVSDSAKTNGQVYINDTFSYCAWAGFLMHGDNISVINNSFTLIGRAVELRDVNNSHCQNFLIEGNIFLDDGTPTETNAGILIDSDTYGDNADFHSGVIRYNYFDNMSGRAIDGFLGNSQIYYNVIGNVHEGAAGSALAIEVNGRNNTVYNNVIYNSTNIGIMVNSDPVAGDVSNIVKNNIVYMPGGNHLIYVASGVTANPVMDNNVFWGGSAGATKYHWKGTQYNFTNWKTQSGGDSNSTETNSLFVNASAANFSLQAGSPAIDAGANVSLTRDFVGTVVPQGSAPDMGAYEFVVVNETPAPSPRRGGGGGGGGGDTTENVTCLVRGASTAHIFDQLSPNQTYTLVGPGSAFLIRNATFTVTASIPTGGTFTLIHIKDLACELTPAVGVDYRTLGYERIDYTGVSPRQIANVTITFAVPLANITALGASPDGVSLLRYDGANWRQLSATLVSTEAGSATYVAASPGLSVFAVAVSAPTASPPPSQTTAGPGQVTGGATAGQGAGSAGQASSSSGSAPAGSAGTRTTGRSLSLFSVLTVLVLGGALVGYYYYNRHQKIAAVNAAVSELEVPKREPLIGFATIHEEALKDPVEKLRAYIDKELRQGFHREEVAAQLRKKGWPKNVIAAALDQFTPRYLETRGMHPPHDDYGKLNSFLKEKLSLGYGVDVIKGSLVKVGWDEALVSSLLRDLQQERADATAAYSAEAIASLRAFIAEELQHGHTKTQIRAALLKTGWQAKAVDEELARR